MPIYEYRCEGCGEEFEALVLKNSPVPTCPSCSGSQLSRRVSLSMVSSRDRQVRSYRAEERRRDRENTERARSTLHDHDHDHDH